MHTDPVRYVPPVYRPPSEAQSLILPVTDGCSWNKCTFCEMYTDPQKRFRPRAEEEVFETIRHCAGSRPGAWCRRRGGGIARREARGPTGGQCREKPFPQGVHSGA